MPNYRSYKTELDPNNKQKTLLSKSAGVARFAYNWGIDKVKEAWASGEKTPSGFDLTNLLNAVKREQFPWMYEVSTHCSGHALIDLDRAFKAFCDSRNGKRKGSPVRFPKYKSKHNSKDSFRLRGSIHISERSIQLPRLGTIKLKETGYLPTSGVKILSATVSHKADRWFVSLCVEMGDPTNSIPKDTDDPLIGVDLGIKTLAVCSDGQTFENPKALKRNLKKLRRLNKAVSRKKKGSNNRKKAVSKLSKLHYHISNIRSDTLHKLTAHLTRTKSAVVIEDLNVAGMRKNKHLAQAISDVGFGELRRQLEYKGAWYGCQIIVAPRFFPSSKTCSECGWINDSLSLSDREWSCQSCGTAHDRDHNAAVNLLLWGVNFPVAGSSSETLNVCGEEGSGGRVSGYETSLCEAGIRQVA